MFRSRYALLLFMFAAIFALVGCGGVAAGPGSSGSSGGTGNLKSVNHIVIMMQENRSFDHYFGHLSDYRQRLGVAGTVDGTPANVALPTWSSDASVNTSVTVSPFHMTSVCSEDLSQSWVEFHIDMDLFNPNSSASPPPMNGFAYTAGGFAQHAGATDVLGKRAVGYYTDADLPYYYWAATQFGTSDRWFSPAPTRTQPNRMYLLAATSEGYAYPPDFYGNNGITAPPIQAKTIFELLEQNNVSWRVYVTNYDANPDVSGTYMRFYTSFYKAHLSNFVPATQFATDAKNGTLPQVALIESGYESAQDEHPNNPVDAGAAYAKSFVDALMGSTSWKDSVFFLTFDEAGGLYDHVPPFSEPSPDGIKPIVLPTDPPGDFNISGFRVPLMVISPFAIPHYVSHTNADFTAMLKFIETRFGLSSLTKRDAAQPDMTEFFDFSSAPNMNPGTPPAQPTGGPCNPSQL